MSKRKPVRLFYYRRLFDSEYELLRSLPGELLLSLPFTEAIESELTESPENIPALDTGPGSKKGGTS